ncbi:MFS transporter [Candidatus Gracilibacteria bacterium]|nr:MFS transporter [Candidatus Gracilibacteria bacterium]NJM88168.1 MFS transporter [Hydrococcus sp. RU_2_2]NJP19622.1 MFS transporter [Hydrococcus sp. CRU_1_1]
MLKIPGDFTLVKSQILSPPELLQPINDPAVEIVPILPSVQPSKNEIRTSLKASTLDHIFSTIFSCVTADVLLSNFLLDLGATNIEIGFLAAIPMLANFIQPIGAYLADRANSRCWYSLQVFAPSRLLWLILVLGVVGFEIRFFEPHQLIEVTLFIALATHLCGALGSSSWVSWMAVLVPQRLRGRYFGLRNSAANLTNFLCVPLLGMLVSHWQGGTIQGYALVLMLAVLAGLVSLSFQLFMVDVNPKAATDTIPSLELVDLAKPSTFSNLLKDTNFLKYLFYYGLWMFAVNLSFPFFNVYLLKDLGLDISLVTFYNSLTAGVNVLMLVFWGKLADRVGNRLMLISIGTIVALIPLLWLGIGIDTLSIWLWLPLLYAFSGSTWAAIDLCSNNLQMAISPHSNSSSYFAIAAAVSGLGGALGTTTGGFLAHYAFLGGISGLFVLSTFLRLLALFPLILLREPGRGSFSLVHLLPRFLVPQLTVTSDQLSVISDR